MKVRAVGTPMHSLETVMTYCPWVPSVWPKSKQSVVIVEGVDNFILACKKVGEEEGKQFIVIDTLDMLIRLGIPRIGLRVMSPIRSISQPLRFPKVFPTVELDTKILGVKLAVLNAKSILRNAED